MYGLNAVPRGDKNMDDGQYGRYLNKRPDSYDHAGDPAEQRKIAADKVDERINDQDDRCGYGQDTGRTDGSLAGSYEKKCHDETCQPCNDQHYAYGIFEEFPYIHKSTPEL